VKSEKQTQTKPKQTQSKPILSAVGGFRKPKMNVSAFLQKDYENKPPSGPKKTNPIQTQTNPILSAVGGFRKPEMNLKLLAGKSGHTRKNLDLGLSLIILLTIFNMPFKRQRFGFPHLYLRLPVQESIGAGKAGVPITQLWIMR